jgi:hypothetical protein
VPSASPRPNRIALLTFLAVFPACGPADEPAVPTFVTTYRQVGTWQGRGPATIGDVMLASGRFRVRWETRDEDSPGQGTFRLTARSAVSGRPLEEIANQRGPGQGSVEIGEEDRRIYDFTVESAHLNWSFSIDDIMTVEAPGRP